MAAATTTRNSGLLNFFIYNDEFGQKEGTEEEKIMLYIPQEDCIDKQIKNVGLCEALIQFTKTFNPLRPCEVLHTQRTRQVFLNPEGRFFIIMTLSIPCNERVFKDGGRTLEYFEENVQDTVLQSVIKQAYTMFRLFNGTYSMILKRSGVALLKEKLQYFYPRYLQTLNFSQFEILDVYHGVSFLPVDTVNFLKVQSFTNLVETTFPVVQHTCFLYNDQLLWTTVNQEDMRILYKYLTTSLFPATTGTVNQSYAGQSSSVNLPNSSNSGLFVTATMESIETLPNTPKRAPRVFIYTDNEPQEYYLVVYRVFNAVLCLIIKTQPLPTPEFYLKLHAFLSMHMSYLSQRISDQLTKKQHSLIDQQYRFLYFNQMNLAVKSSIHGKKSTQLTSVTPDMMRLLVDIHGDFNKITHDGEIVMKNLADCWIVGRRFDNREFFVILNQKNASLVDISDEVKRLMSSNFNTLFFLE